MREGKNEKHRKHTRNKSDYNIRYSSSGEINSSLPSSPSSLDHKRSVSRRHTMNHDRNSSFSENSWQFPISEKGMELARRTIIEQAATIQKLEAKLDLLAEESRFRINNSEIDRCDDGNRAVEASHNIIGSARKKLTPEERLQAHRERKLQENKYMEKVGKWEKPPDLKHDNITKKVKENDDFVQRLASNPAERKRLDEIKRAVKRATRKYSNANEHHQEPNNTTPHNNSHPIDQESTTPKNPTPRNSNDNQNKLKTSESDKKLALMNRLAMGTKQRREENSKNVPDNVKRALRGHTMEKRQWNMTDEYMKEDETNDEEVRNSHYFNEKDDVNREKGSLSKKNQSFGTTTSNNYFVNCATCQSVENCEEDEDNPGTYYCQSCWEEYETLPIMRPRKNSSTNRMDCIPNEIMSQETQINTHKVERYRSKAGNNANALWFVHDNPTLGNNLICSGSKQVNCFLETKELDKKNCLRIIIGSIEYSGKVSKLNNRESKGEKTDVSRGTECIKLVGIIGYKVDLTVIKTRMSNKNRSILEFQLEPENGIILSGRKVEMSACEFLKGCENAVDVILDPQCAPGQWYPFKETQSNRKIAPQFRSKGVGYIRLGDDMGRNGLAFLSSDACNSFFLPVDTDEKMIRTLSSIESLKPTNKKVTKAIRDKSPIQTKDICRKTKQSSKGTPDGDGDDDDASSYYLEDGSCALNDSSEGEDDEETSESIHDIVKELKRSETDASIKWQEKVDLLNRLEKKTNKRTTCKISCSETLKVVQNILSSKNVNIHVLRSSIHVIRKMGLILHEDLVSEMSWKTIMIETLKLLKNKQVCMSAKEMLAELHGQCYTLANCMDTISHVLEIGKASRSSSKRLSHSGSGQTSRASLESNKNKAKANNVEIIEWLAVRTEAEQCMNDVDPVLDRSGLSLLTQIFFTYDGHRDARCRKNALDGLMHTILYAVKKTEMEAKEAKNMCLELKQSNPRAWKLITQSVDRILREEAK